MTTSTLAEDAVAELLQSAFGQSVASYTDAETPRTTVSVYVPTKPDWSHARHAELAARLARIARSGLNIDPGKISLKRIPRQDWAESWKLHFKPMIISSVLLLKPSWSRRRPRRGQAVVVLDPGLTFGTSRHPTTAFCLRQLVAQRRLGRAQSCLDVGTGSGILAIAAAKLGYAPVDAFDCESHSIRIAQANARRNRVSAPIRFRQQDLARLPRWSAQKYSLVCAHLVSNLLLTQRERIIARLGAGGVLTVAGILKAEFAQIQNALAAAGLRLLASRTEEEWRSAAFAWR